MGVEGRLRFHPEGGPGQRNRGRAVAVGAPSEKVTATGLPPRPELPPRGELQVALLQGTAGGSLSPRLLTAPAPPHTESRVPASAGTSEACRLHRDSQRGHTRPSEQCSTTEHGDMVTIREAGQVGGC